MHKLDGRQRAVFVYRVGHQAQGGDILASDQRRASFAGDRSEVGWISVSWVDTTPQPPSAFDAAMGGFGVGVAIAHACAVGHLVKAVARGVWADLHGFEQDVKTGIAHGSGSCLVVAKLGVVEVAVCPV